MAVKSPRIVSITLPAEDLGGVVVLIVSVNTEGRKIWRFPGKPEFHFLPLIRSVNS